MRVAGSTGGARLTRLAIQEPNPISCVVAMMSPTEHLTVPDPDTAAAPSRLCVKVVANARSGTVLAKGAAAFAAEVTRAFEAAGASVEVCLVEGEHVAAAVAESIASPDQRVVIAGGDGTLMRLLPILSKAERPIGLLPLGTVNLLGKDLGFTGDVDHDVALAIGTHVRRVNLARAGSVLFHSNMGLGILGRMAFEREEARRRLPFSRILSFFWAATRTLMLARTLPIMMEVDNAERHFHADAILVTNNAFDDETLRRPELDQELLEVHIVTAPRIQDRLALALAILRGRWRSHAALRTVRCRSLRLERKGRRRTRVAVDGELLRFRGMIDVRCTDEFVEIFGAPPDKPA
ncbi:MAG: diacylglycerol kinase family protein [Beijerinckiaceae bacterium]|nr:diacylglycerol kinase family protein [Beijerinckiaceae bacterium]MCZ8300600.1 diacylglycerol kinase family protein [Beijerinckiaceae bacterium]